MKNMKKVRRFFSVLGHFGLIPLVLVCLMIFSNGCVGESAIDEQNRLETPIDGEGLSVKMVNQIIEDFAKLYGSSWDGAAFDEFVIHHRGTFNGCVVMKIAPKDAQFAAVPGKDVVAGIEFFYGYASFTLRVWKEGQFYSLTEAYNQGFLTQENLESISMGQSSTGNYYYGGKQNE